MKHPAIDSAVAAQQIDDGSRPANAEAEKGRDVAKLAVSPLAICRAAALYFALTFAAGFALGAIRIFAIAHGLGEWQAVLIETPFMLLISWKACGLAIGIFDISGRAAAFGVGAIAFLLLQSAELTLALLAFDKSPGDFVAGYRTAAGMIGLSGQVAFGFFPWVKVELR